MASRGNSFATGAQNRQFSSQWIADQLASDNLQLNCVEWNNFARSGGCPVQTEFEFQSQDFTYLSHGQPPCRHRSLHLRPPNYQRLTSVASFRVSGIPGCCPPFRSNLSTVPGCCPSFRDRRKSGQHHTGIAGQLRAEWVDNFEWNAWTTWAGIRSGLHHRHERRAA